MVKMNCFPEGPVRRAMCLETTSVINQSASADTTSGQRRDGGHRCWKRNPSSCTELLAMLLCHNSKVGRVKSLSHRSKQIECGFVNFFSVGGGGVVNLIP